LAITDLNLEEGLKLSVQDLYSSLALVHHGLSSYMKIMGHTNEEDLQEAACRLMGKFTLYHGDSKRSVQFTDGKWVYVSDPSLRLIESAPRFREAVENLRQLMK
jgi:hypothetical protein